MIRSKARRPLPMAGSGKPIRKWEWQLRRIGRTLWVRASLYGLASVATALLALVLKPYVPPDFGTRIGADSVDAILNILASSMLAVTTFSLGIMLSAFSGVSGTATPRANSLLMDDTTTQGALATFLGAFLYSLVGIIALKTGIYGDSGRLILFIVTVAVVVVIFVTFIRWIEILRRFGRLSDALERIEQAAGQALNERLSNPYLGGRKRCGPPPVGAVPVHPEETGYVQHIDVEALSLLAEEQDLEVYLEALPGAFVTPDVPLLWLCGKEIVDRGNDWREAWSIARERTFHQDPRFGLTVLAEVASRALSPAVNDPGTAIDILGRGVRLLSVWPGRLPPEPIYPRLHVPPLSLDDCCEDFFRPIARDGAGLVEVQIRLQKMLSLLAAGSVESEWAEAMEKQSLEALERALLGLGLVVDQEKVRRLAAPWRAVSGGNSGC